ncbi:MAG: AraC family transcriptional regulator [Pyrinomonadaceae bacterium]
MQIDFFNPRSVICLIAILQGAIFAGLLLWRFIRKGQKADFWLALLLVVLCLGLITPLIGFANVYDLNQWLTYFPFWIAYSNGVLVWLYTLHLTDSKRRFRAKDLFLFIPSTAYLAFRFFLFAHDLEWKEWFSRNYESFFGGFIFVTQLIWNLVFLFLAIRHYRRYRAWLDQNFSDTEKIKFDWLSNFLHLFTSVLLVGGIFDFTDSFLFKLSYIQYFYFELILALLTYYLAIAGYLRSRTIELSFSPEKESEAEDRKTLISERELEKLKARLKKLMEEEKPHLDPNLTLADLSRRLGVNSVVLSYTINSGFDQNFNDFVNGFRVAEVVEKLETSDDSTLLALAFECGFNSKSTFNRAFKKITGRSPREFQINLVSNQ